MEKLIVCSEWIDYPWEMGFAKSDLVSKEMLEIILKACPNLHYSYVLWRIKNGRYEPFYVGKGTGKRVLTHGTKSDDSYNKIKMGIMKRAVEDKSFCYSIRFFKTEKEALEKEANLISVVGTIATKTGPLANLNEGGVSVGTNAGKKGEENVSSIPVFVGDRKFGSMAEAAREFGICIASVRNRCERSSFPDWKMNGIEKFLVKGIRRPAMPVIVDGVQYVSTCEASKYLGIGPSAVKHRCVSPNYPNWILVDAPKKPLKPKATKIRVLAQGVLYESITEAARVYGLSPVGMRNRCESASFPDFEYKGSNRCPE